MRRRIIIGIVISAGSLFTLVPRTVAQDEPPVRNRRTRAQVTPGAPEISEMPSASRQLMARQQVNSSRANSQFHPVSAVPRSPIPQNALPTASPSPRSKKKVRRDQDLEAPNRYPGNNGQRTLGPPRQTSGQNSRTRETADSSGERQKSSRSQPKKEQADQAAAQRPEHAAGAGTDQGEHVNRQFSPDRHQGERTIVIPTRTPPIPNVPMQIPEAAPIISAPAAPIVSAPMERPPQPPPQDAQAPARPLQTRAPSLTDLSDDERTRLHSAHESALQDPNLAASRERYMNARKEFRDKLRDALLKADPAVQPILEKIRRDKPEDR